MDCLHCKSSNVLLCKNKTDQRYWQYCCGTCNKQLNERTHTLFNFIQYCTEVVMLALHYYYRFRASLDDVVELMKMRVINLSYQTVLNWAQTFGIQLASKLREKPHGHAGKK